MNQKCPRKFTQKITRQLSQEGNTKILKEEYNLLIDLINTIVLSLDCNGLSKNWSLAASFSKWRCHCIYMSPSHVQVPGEQSSPEHENSELFVDGWSMKSLKDVETGELSREDTLKEAWKCLIWVQINSWGQL